MKLDRAWSKERWSRATSTPSSTGTSRTARGGRQTYFAAPARWLTLPQAALLAGLTQAPSVFDPFIDPAGAIARRDQVLLAMLA